MSRTSHLLDLAGRNIFFFIMDLRSKEEFEFFMQRALESFTAGSNTDDNYIELYNILLR